MNKWWQERVFYQIYPRSFCDSDGDGIGDIKGIISKLDYLKNLGVGALWLSPLYRSPNDDYGYDISDYLDINPEYGTMRDFEDLLKEAHMRDIKIIMDLVINHTSDEHEWFKKSRDKDSQYRDYYFWRQGRGGGKKPPNNWTSFFSGPAWQRDEESGEWYLRLFSKKQPDLNLSNPKVVEEIKKILRFYLDMGIDGFRCDVINVIYKTSLLDGKNRFVLKGLEHYHSQEGCHRLLKEFSTEIFEKYDAFTVGETVLVSPQQARDLTDTGRHELNSVFSFEHMEVDQWLVKWFKTKFKPHKLYDTLTKWQNGLETNTVYFENHDQPRSVGRFGSLEYRDLSAKALCTLLLCLRGIPFIYQGQEIAMANYPFDDLTDFKDTESHSVYHFGRKLGIPKKLMWKLITKTSRDNARTPVQWTGGKNAGFTSGTPWLKVNPDHTEINVEAQSGLKSSVLEYYRGLIRFRNGNDILKSGAFKRIYDNKSVFCFERETLEGKLVVFVNLTNKTQRLKNLYRGEAIAGNYDDIKNKFDELRPYEAAIIKSLGKQ